MSTAQTTLLPALDSFEDNIAQPIEYTTVRVPQKQSQYRMAKQNSLD
ncbi:hypothetical protein [Rhizobium ruizarguesonis]|nr:hypothetical protein [Rhizobium ruizarguesonis]